MKDDGADLPRAEVAPTGEDMDAFLFQAGRMLGGRWADEAEAAQDAHLATLSGRKNATVGMDGGSDQPPPDTATETDAVSIPP